MQQTLTLKATSTMPSHFQMRSVFRVAFVMTLAMDGREPWAQPFG